MEMTELIRVSAVYQLPTPFNGWIYRITVDNEGVSLKRVPENSPHWSHGIISQRLPMNEQHFVMSMNCGVDHQFETIEQAIDFIGIYKEADS